MRIEDRIVVEAPITECYRLAIDFEQYPSFLKPVKSIRHKGSSGVWQWEVSGINGQTWTWDIEVVGEKHNNQVISWRTLRQGDVAHSGAMTLKSVSGAQTEIHLTIEFRGNTISENTLESRGQEVIREALESLKHFVETHARAAIRK
jgi:uncharacterized membrane protein